MYAYPCLYSHYLVHYLLTFLLKNNHTTNDSGFGGSTLNTNGNSTEPNSLDKNKKYSIQNGGIVQNGHHKNETTPENSKIN
jgi:hypothetical protein